MPQKYQCKKPREYNERGALLPAKRGPAKGSTSKRRRPEIEALEKKVVKWVEEKVDGGLLVTGKLAWKHFILLGREEGLLPGDVYFGFKPGNKHSWLQQMRPRHGLELTPVRQCWENPMSAARLFSNISSYFRSSYKFFKETAFPWKATPGGQAGGPEDVVMVNVDEVGFEHEVRGKALTTRKSKKMPVTEKKKWKYSMGIPSTNRPDFFLRPYVAVDRADEDAHEALRQYCPIDYLYAKSAKDTVQGVGSFADNPLGSLITSLSGLLVDHKRWAADWVFQKCGHDWRRPAEMPQLESLHTRFRVWWKEQSDEVGEELYWSAKPLDEEWKDIKKKDLEVDKVLNWCKKECIYMRGIQQSWFTDDELKFLP
eukprot:g20638.t1